ncbi:MAG: hypothetical protein AABW80_04465 [Nanoarchaeota archaeon]|mgnify:CR=1 FL=1
MMNNKGQIKIQEMAFVLMAIFVFFALVGLMFISYRVSNLREGSEVIKEDATKELLKNIANTPELSWAGCSNCIDLDKAVVLNGNGSSEEQYAGLFGLNYMKIERIYPKREDGECILGAYPRCSELTLVDTKEVKGTSSSAFVALCKWDGELNTEVCELGRVIASGSGLNEN